MNFGALSRGFGTCCLRFKNRVATIPAKLASGWLARLYREGVEPSGSLQKVSDHISRPPFLDLSWRKGSFILNLPPFTSLDHLVGERQQRRRDVDGERFGGREINDHFEFCWLRDRQVGWFLAFEDAARIDASELVYVVVVRPVTDQPADIGIFAAVIDGGQRVARCQRDDQCATSEKERVDSDQQCRAGLLREICESRLDVAIAAASIKDFNGQP